MKATALLLLVLALVCSSAFAANGRCGPALSRKQSKGDKWDALAAAQAPFKVLNMLKRQGSDTALTAINLAKLNATLAPDFDGYYLDTKGIEPGMMNRSAYITFMSYIAQYASGRLSHHHMDTADVVMSTNGDTAQVFSELIDFGMFNGKAALSVSTFNATVVFVKPTRNSDSVWLVKEMSEQGDALWDFITPNAIRNFIDGGFYSS
jgi:hypothetical protein